MNSNSLISTKMRRKFLYILLAVFFIGQKLVYCQNHPYSLKISKQDLTVIIDETEIVQLLLNGELDKNLNVTFIKQHNNLIDINPPWINLNHDSNNSNNIYIKGLQPGHLEVTVATQPNNTWIGQDVFVRVTVANSWAIYYISLTFGWIYFVAWSISFYPQIITNFRRKSVVGLNFDFLALNLVGFLLYSIFNIGLFWIPAIEKEYFERFPRGLNPVLINDIFFSLHATFATCITIYQCVMYERGNQRISYVAFGLLAIFAIIVIISIILSAVAVIHWLDFFYISSYVKLSITLIKYIPQAVMNYRRKSTVGWSIGNIILDFLGGILSMLQMILNASNYDDWHSIFGDPTKFGLGLFSVCFDIFFMLQHYVFYRNNQPYEDLDGNDHIENDPFVNPVIDGNQNSDNSNLRV